jgi:hypothetical protein
MEIISCDKKLKVGYTSRVKDKYSKQEANFCVIRIATKEEYLEYRKGKSSRDLGYYYEISLD